LSGILIRGGRVLDPARRFDDMADVLLLESRVEAIGRNLGTPPGVMVVDATGQVVAPGIAHEIAAAMRLAVNGDIGRIFTSGAALRNMVVAGKSGTAELGTGRPHSWFIGFAPYDNPQVAIAVLVEHSGRGDVKASPIAGDLLRAWRNWAPG